MPTKPDTGELSHYLAETLLGWRKDPETPLWWDPKKGEAWWNLEPLATTYEGMGLVIPAMRERHLYAEIEVEPDRYRVSYYKPYFAGPVHWGLVGQAEHERLPEANAEAAVAALEREQSESPSASERSSTEQETDHE